MKRPSIFNQTRRSRRWGGIKHTYQQSLPYMTLWNFCMLTSTAYYTTIREWFYTYGIPLQWWHMALFVGFLISVAFVIMTIEHKYSIPSLYHYTWDMGYTHSTLLRGEINKINEKLDLIMKEKGIDYDETAKRIS